MTIDEVKNLLGVPFDILTQQQPAALENGQNEKIETWIYQRRGILVTIGFRNGFVINKWWNDKSAAVAREDND